MVAHDIKLTLPAPRMYPIARLNYVEFRSISHYFSLEYDR